MKDLDIAIGFSLKMSLWISEFESFCYPLKLLNSLKMTRKYRNYLSKS